MVILKQTISIILVLINTLALVSLSVHADLFITQVFYDPAGTDTGKEWVEIYNPTDEAVALDSYSLETGNGAAEDSWTLEWNGTGETISSKGFFLIGENESLVDHMTALDLQNGPDAVRLNIFGEPISTVGWGDLLFTEYYEGSPAALTGSGMSLQRSYAWEGSSRIFSQTSDNSVDFSIGTPSPRSSGYGGLEVELIILEESLHISNLTIENSIEGNMILPAPGQDKEVIVRVIVESSNGFDTVSIVGSALGTQFDLAPDGQLGPTEGAFTGAFPLPFSTPAGTYSLTVAVDSGTQHEEVSMSFEVMPVAAVEIDTGVLRFPEATKGSIFELPGDTDMGTADLPTLRNIGNEDIDITISGTDLLSGSGSVSISLLSYAIEGIFGSVTKTQETIPIGLVSGETVPLTFSVSVPSDISGGTYTGNVLLSAVAR